LIEKDNSEISISRQCELLSLSRSTVYYKNVEKDDSNIKLMNIIDEIYTESPFYGRRRITKHLNKVLAIDINVKKVRRLMKVMGIEAIYPKKNLSMQNSQHKKYPYLLSGVDICRVNQVWSTDITYIRLKQGFVYLCAVIDWYSRYVLSWKLSNTMETTFCLEALVDALKLGKPDIFNTDQGSQFTSHEFTNALLSNEIKISMDGKGRVFDNIFVERLWRSVKYENIYPNSYETYLDTRSGLLKYFNFYNNDRLHQSLNYETPKSVYFGNILSLKGGYGNAVGL
jgi:putative transposase